MPDFFFCEHFFDPVGKDNSVKMVNFMAEAASLQSFTLIHVPASVPVLSTHLDKIGPTNNTPFIRQ